MQYAGLKHAGAFVGMDGETVREPGESRAGWLVPAVSVVLALVLVAVVFANGWLSDDAFITFRTVDNLIHGRGMTWNPGWRVQVFTHPSWMMLVALVSTVTGHIPLTALWLGFVVSLVSVLILSRAVARQGVWRVPPFLLVLVASKAFVDYSTGGLENPLSHLSLALLLLELSPSGGRAARPTVLGLVTGLLFLTRMDLVLLAAPAVAMALWEAGVDRRRLGFFLAGLLPTAVWLLFATFYFGTPLPNTAWAKLGTGIAEPLLLQQGLAYLWNSLRWDPITLATVVLALALAGTGGSRVARALGAGMAVYLAYVVWIGGDFMSGRFLTPVFLCGAFLLTVGIPRCAAGWLAVAVLASVVLNPLAPVRVLGTSAGAGTDGWGISDERAGYVGVTGVRVLLDSHRALVNPWRERAVAFRRSDQPLRVRLAVGMFGYYAGPKKIVVDVLGITDPLLARLPARDPARAGWRIGHFPRNIPEGYLETLALGKDRIVEPHLAVWFDKLHLIATGPLFDPERLRAIVAMNLGRYRHLLRAYRRSGACEIPAESVVWKPLTVEALRQGLRCP